MKSYIEIKNEFNKLVNGTRDGSNAYWFVQKNYKKLDETTVITWKYPDSNQIFTTSRKSPISYLGSKELCRAFCYVSISDGIEKLEKEFIVSPRSRGTYVEISTQDASYEQWKEPAEDVESMSPLIQDQYTKSDFLKEVYISDSDYETLTSLLIHKKNIILQGAPGVGKTFTAKRLAYSILGCKDESKVKLIQFHQSYSYEDFIMGYKPEDTGFVLRHGIFYDFCIKAANNPNEKYFFIIDEINRGNLSKIFGELLMMIESDYRGEQMTMAYDGLQFCVPENLYIIGMMNTADRSLAMIDYALRRRFSFYNMSPAFDNEIFIQYQKTLNTKDFDDVLKVIKRLNKEIAEDASLGDGFCIGHSYFCGQIACSKEWLEQVIKYDIIPMINEYWFDNKSKAEKWAGELLEVLN